MNSLFRAIKFLELGIAIALLIIANGIELINPLLNVEPPKRQKEYAKPKLISSIWKIAIKEDFLIIFNLDLFNSNSKEPSNTININPIVPKIGNIGIKLGIGMLKKIAPCFTHQPKISNKMTVGIFVLDELTSKR